MTSASVPMEVIHATPCVPLTVTGPKGTETLRCWVDTGGGATFVVGSVAARLGLESTEMLEEAGERLALLDLSSARIGGRTIDLSSRPVGSMPDTFFARTEAKAFLPGKVLSQHRIVFDYPSRRFTVADSSDAVGAGTRVASPVSELGFARVDVGVGGRAHGLLLDTGASHTMVSDDVFDEWHAAHPDWPVRRGAVGTANMGHVAADGQRRMMRIPELTIGDSIVVRNASVVTRPSGVFERYMSALMTAPVVGALAGNVLRHFRVEIDFVAGATYFAPESVDVVPQFTAPVVLAKSDRGIEIHETLSPLLRVGDLIADAEGSLPRAMQLVGGGGPGTRSVAVERDGDRVKIVVDLVEV